MKQSIVIIGFLFIFNSIILGQKPDYISGSISYVTSQNVYVKFNSTKDISKGDTLYIFNTENYNPALIVSNKSSISVVCKPIAKISFQKGQSIFYKWNKDETQNQKEESIEAATIVSDNDVVTEIENSTLNSQEKAEPPPLKTQERADVSGKISVSSYSNFSSERPLVQRMRYTLALNTDHISNSNFSTETYVSFNHTNNNWDQIKNNVFNGLKIYNLAVKYESKKDLNIYLGRKISSHLSSLGAIDGLQVSKGLGSFKIGAIAGSRPDLNDYSFNINLFQAGIFAGHEWKNQSNALMRNNIAVVEQQNSGNTDRRFLYFQHYQSLVKNLSLFGSLEMDLYKKINGVSQNDFSLTNLYLLIRYRALRNLSLSASYSNRNNIIYYETYKSFIDQLLDRTRLQGFRFTVNYRPISKISIGVRTSYRSRKSDVRPNINLNGYFNFISIPGINLNVSLSATYLETSYLNGSIYGLRLNKDIIKRKLYGSLNYRYVKYSYTYTDMQTNQNIPEIQLNWRILRDLRATFALEAIFEKDYQYQRVYFNISKRF